ncbi:hypothetical protein ABGB07_02075 [Micromonosporaceae bacterium B7E4]
MTPDLDPAGWWPDRDTHDLPKVRAPYRVRFLRRRADRRRLRAVLLQSVALLLLSGGVLILAGVGEVYADQRYDGTPDRKAPGFCYVEHAPAGVARCHGAEVQP